MKPIGTSVTAIGNVYCFCHATTAQSVDHNTLTPIIYQTELVDTHAMHAANGSVFTVAAGQAGDYMVVGRVYPVSNAATTAYMQLKHNSTVVARRGLVSTDGSLGQMLTHRFYNMAVGDAVLMEVFQNVGAAQDYNGWTVSPNFGSSLAVWRVA